LYNNNNNNNKRAQQQQRAAAAAAAQQYLCEMIVQHIRPSLALAVETSLICVCLIHVFIQVISTALTTPCGYDDDDDALYV